MADSLPLLLVRARGGQSVDALAERAGIAPNSIRNAEAGKLVRENTLRAILRAAKPTADLRTEILAEFDRLRAERNVRRAMARNAKEGA